MSAQRWLREALLKALADSIHRQACPKPQTLFSGTTLTSNLLRIHVEKFAAKSCLSTTITTVCRMTWKPTSNLPARVTHHGKITANIWTALGTPPGHLRIRG